jgi:hypothetical protein
MLKTANIEFAGGRNYSAWRTCFISAFSVHRVIFGTNFVLQENLEG